MSLPQATGSPTPMIVAPRVFDGERWHERMAVGIAGGRVVGFAPASTSELPPGAVVLPAGAVLAPGFIDLQVNGGGGVLLNDAPTPATVWTMLAAHRRGGTTGCLPTLITADVAVLDELAGNAAAIAAIPGVLGLHLEGPFLNVQRKGVHAAHHVRAPAPRELAAIAAIARATRVMVTLAPECVPRGFIARLVALGVVVALGHSDATAAQVHAALDEGATAVTHLFNAMRQMTAREPGIVGTALDDARLTAGLICDGWHVDAANMRTALKAMGRARLALVTDAMPSLGGGATFQLDGRTITLREGRLTAPDGTLAGAHLGMIDAVRNARRLLQVPLDDALVMASQTPARLLGLGHSHGRIGVGSNADFVALSPEIDVTATWIGGYAISTEPPGQP